MIWNDGLKPWTWVLASILAVAVYQLSVLGALFFLLPLQWVKIRHGDRFFLLASVLVAAGIGGVETALRVVTHGPWTMVDTALLGFPLVLIVGWVVIIGMEQLRWRFLYRLLLVTAIAGLVVFPWVSNLFSQGTVTKALEDSFAAVWKQMFEAPAVSASGTMGTVSRSEFFDLLKEAFLGSFLLVFFLIWGFTGRMSRVLDRSSGPWTLKGFFVPAQGAWVLLGLWGLILVQGLFLRTGVKWDWGGGLYVVLNAAWIALVVHALAGWGIIHVLMDRAQMPRWGQSGVRMLLVLLVLVPGPGQWLVLGGLPMLAVLELWVNFRKRTQGVGL